MPSRKNMFQKRRGRGILWIGGKPDIQILTIVLGLSVFGWIMVYSSSFIATSNPFYFFVRQGIYILLGLIAGYIAYSVNYKVFAKLIVPGIIVSIILLLIVLIPGIGKEINGARRWIDLGIIDLQPSELVKIVFIVYLAAWASKQKARKGITKDVINTHIKEDLIPFVSILGIICGLVLFEPDLATTGIIGITAISVYFLSGRDSIHTLGTFVILVVMLLSGVLAGVLAPYRFERVQTYMEFIKTGEVQDPLGSGYQLQNILIAVGSGGITGVGFGESKQKFHYLGQTAFSDNIFAVIAEEFGLIGSLILTILFMYILTRGLKIASKIPDRFGKLLASGIIIWIVLQAFLHIATNIGLIPVTGIPMPFISYGGSSVLVTMIAIAIYLNVSREARLN